MLKQKIKIFYDFDEHKYIVAIDGMDNLTGFGDNETEALMDFFNKYDNYKNSLNLGCIPKPIY